MPTTAAPRPTIVFVPGFWEPPSFFSAITSLLTARGYPTHVVPLPSTGQLTPPTGTPPLMLADVAAIRAVVSKLVEQQRRTVVMVLHSAGGFLGSMAVEGLLEPERRSRREEGGVRGLVGLAAAFWDVRDEGVRPPSAVYRDGGCFCASPNTFLFNDLAASSPPINPSTIPSLVSQLKPQPADGYDAPLPYCAWKHVPTVYLLCGADTLVVPELQRKFIANAKSRVVE